MNLSKHKNIKFSALITLMLIFAILLSGCSTEDAQPGVYVDIKANGSTQMTLIYDLEDRALLDDAADEVSVLIPPTLLTAKDQIKDLLKGYFRKKDISFKSFDVFPTYYQVILSTECVKPISELDNIYPGVDLGAELTLNQSDMFLSPVSVITPANKHTEISLTGTVSAKTTAVNRISESIISGKTELVGNVDYNEIMLVFHQTYSLFDRMLIILIGIIMIISIGLFVLKFLERNREELL